MNIFQNYLFKNNPGDEKTKNKMDETERKPFSQKPLKYTYLENKPPKSWGVIFCKPYIISIEK